MRNTEMAKLGGLVGEWTTTMHSGMRLLTFERA
jgi:hypothetical protein